MILCPENWKRKIIREYDYDDGALTDFYFIPSDPMITISGQFKGERVLHFKGIEVPAVIGKYLLFLIILFCRL